MLHKLDERAAGRNCLLQKRYMKTHQESSQNLRELTSALRGVETEGEHKGAPTTAAFIDGQSRSSTWNNSQLFYLCSRFLPPQFNLTAHPCTAVPEAPTCRSSAVDTIVTFTVEAIGVVCCSHLVAWPDVCVLWAVAQHAVASSTSAGIAAPLYRSCVDSDVVFMATLHPPLGLRSPQA